MHAQLRFSIWRDLLAPLQIARIYVHAYPNSIDVVALSKCAANLHRLRLVPVVHAGLSYL